jgi:hypothetical protein
LPPLPRHRTNAGGIAGLLAEDGRLLIVMLPTHFDYPLFSAAVELFESLQPDPEAIAGYLRDAGLETSVSYESFPPEARLPGHGAKQIHVAAAGIR